MMKIVKSLRLNKSIRIGQANRSDFTLALHEYWNKYHTDKVERKVHKLFSKHITLLLMV
jgi:hypothetical protein